MKHTASYSQIQTEKGNTWTLGIKRKDSHNRVPLHQDKWRNRQVKWLWICQLPVQFPGYWRNRDCLCKYSYSGVDQLHVNASVNTKFSANQRGSITMKVQVSDHLPDCRIGPRTSSFGKKWIIDDYIKTTTLVINLVVSFENLLKMEVDLLILTLLPNTYYPISLFCSLLVEFLH